MRHTQHTVRRMTYRDTADVMRIDSGAWCVGITYGDVDTYVRETRKLRGLVGEYRGVITGFALLRFDHYAITIDGFLVSEPLRRQGYGRDMLDYVLAEAARLDKLRVKVTVRAENLAAQLFFSKSGLDRSRIVSGAGDKFEKYLLWKELV